jgi:formate dehydrogenase beta subunit/formate dehydrogenase gamma subunit
VSGVLDIKRISATRAALGAPEAEQVAMLIDATTCIGCKACEVACVEWNDLAVEPEMGERVLHSLQTIPDMTPSFWNLIRFDEIAVDDVRRPMESASDGAGTMMLMRKDMCMHCAEPGCLLACPAEGAIVQLANGIVDFQQEHCIGCGYCMTGCPFDIPKFDPGTRRVYKCTMCSDRVANGLGPACVKACPTGCLEFGTKADMVRHAEARAERLREDGFAHAGVYDPPGVGGTGVVYVLHHADQPELYGGLPRDPHVDLPLALWQGPMKLLSGISMGLSVAMAGAHYLVAGPRREAAASASASAAPRRDVVRYSLLERLLHWTVAASFVYLALTGLGLLTPKLAWLLGVLGGGQVARAWHPIVGCVFVVSVFWQAARWLRDLRLTAADWAWLARMRDYLMGRDAGMPATGRFNAGQKLLFWAQVAMGVVLLLSGVPLWWPEDFPRWLRAWALPIHSASAVVAVISLVAHVHMSVFVTRGALRAMTEGKVSEDWARHHHADWADEVLGPER